ncbi:uncharacterized protein LOC133721462 [Rosa rugosa]|uniref:uncharacterized protein LOC133721462 n=1 Tax=Rosa rugosa TaxID=74645 RepID=UPI002B417DAB|nr:uncharacterized protein LOC133721462 [Rosa rugosa]
MPRRHNNDMDLMIPGKIRKRGCSSSASSSSSIIQNYRFKRAILVGKRGGSTTPVPTWKLMGSRSPASALRGAMESPKYAPSQGGGVSKGKQSPRPPVSARKLAATLWEMNDVPSPRVKEEVDERRMRKEIRAREKERVARSLRSGSLPPHLSDPSHSPVSERMDRSGTGSFHRRSSSISQRLRLTDQHSGILDSHGNGSLMEVESRSRAQTPTRSRAQTPSASTVGIKPRLKDVSNALTTSKELLKIIHRIWGNEDQPSSSMALISALHAELERARLLVNQHIHEQRSEQNEISYLMKCFAEEKAAWKSKEHKVVEAAIESVAEELEVERKLRRRLEGLNKKLGKELAETKASLVKAVKELESEKRTREIMEQVCDELARDINEDKLEAEELKWESAKVREEVEKEREMMQFSDVLREGRAQEKLSEAKYQLEEKNAAVDMLRSQLEAFMGSKRTKEKARGSAHLKDEDIAAYLSRTRLGSHQGEEKDEDGGEVEDGVECKEDSAESDLHSIELSMGNNNKSYNWSHASVAARDPRWAPNDDEEIKGRKSMSGKPPRKSTSLQRSISDGLEWGMQTERLQNSGDRVDWESFPDLERQMQGKGCGDEMQGYKSSKGLRDQMLSGSRFGSARVHASPTRQWGQPWPSRDPTSAVHDRPPSVHGSGSKSRLAELRGEGQNGRRSKR